MAKQITELTAASALTGTELAWVEQGGLPRKATTQAIADLASGGTAIADGTVEGNTLYWDDTGGAWTETAEVSFDVTNTALSIGDHLTIEDQGGTPGTSGITELKNGAGTVMIRFLDTDGPWVEIDDFNLKLADAGASISRKAAWWGGSRNEIKTLADGEFNFSAENANGTPRAHFDYPINIATKNASSAKPVIKDGSSMTFHPRNVSSSFNSAMFVQNGTAISWPVGQATSVHYAYSSVTTAADPGVPMVRFNTADFSTTTTLYVSDEDLTNEDQGWFFGRAAVGDVLLMSQGSDRGRWVEFEIDSITDSTGYWTIGVTALDHAGTIFVNGQDLRIDLLRSSLIPGTGAIADGTATGNTLYWSGSAWVENALVTSSASQLNIVATPADYSAAPSIAFNGNTGFYEGLADYIYVGINGTPKYYFADSYISGVTSSSFYLTNEATSRTNPTLGPRRDLTTGLGSAAASEMSLIAGSVEIMRIVEGANDYILSQTPIFIAERAAAQPDITSTGQLYTLTSTGGLYYKGEGVSAVRLDTVGGGTGTVTSVSVVTANGVSGSVATATTTPAITLTLGAITPTSTNGILAANLLSRIATEQVTGLWEFSRAASSTIVLDNSGVGSAGIRYQNNNGTRGYTAMDNSGTWATFDSSAAATGFSVTSGGVVAATTITGANVTSGSNPGHTHTGSSISSLDAGDITTGTLPVLRGGTGVTTSTGTGNVVLSASPSFTGVPVFAADLFSNAIGLNTDPGPDNSRFSGYGIMGARGTFYVSNVDGAVALNHTGVHNANTKLVTTATGVTVTGTMAATTVTGANVTSGANPGHTHTGSSISALDAGDITTGTLAVLRGGTGVTTSSGSGPNALGTVSSAQSNSTIMQRDASGYAYAIYYNATGSFSTTGADSGMDNFIGTNGSDTFARSYSQVGAIARLQTGAWTFSGSNIQSAGTLRFNDGINLAFGNSSDVQIDFNGATSFTLDMLVGNDFLVRGGTGLAPMFVCNSDADAQLYHQGTVAAVTKDRAETGVTSSLAVYDTSGTQRDVGYNVLPTFNFNVSDTLESGHCGHATGKTNTTTTYKLTGPTSSNVDFPVGAVTHVWNLGASGNYTIEDTSTCTMYYCDGAAAPVDIALNGTLLPGGMITLWRYSTTAIYITGSGFTP
jgi:hypothetical protein